MGLKFMKANLEENYKLNGADSRIHCLEFNFKESVLIDYHYHEYIEILFFLSGNGLVCVNGHENLYEANTLVIVNSQRAHAIKVLSPSQYICIKVSPDIFYCDEIMYALPFISEERNGYVFKFDQADEIQIRSLLKKVMQEWNEMNYGFELAIRSLLLDFFLRVLRQRLHNNDIVYNMNKISPAIQSAIIYVANNFTTITEYEISKLCHLSYNYFSYLFKKTMGKSFKDYLLDTKLYHAEKLLLSTNKSITEIALEIGFSTTSHFISLFKKKNGTTPAKFRKIRF